MATKKKTNKEVFKPVGRWIAVDTTWKKETTTESGVIYNETQNQQFIKSKVIAVSDYLTEDIKVNDTIYWDPRESKGQKYKNYYLVHESWVALVEDVKSK